MIRKDFVCIWPRPLLGPTENFFEHNGFAWLTLPVANKYLKFKILKIFWLK